MPLRDINIYCTSITSVHDEEWICHTCLTSLKEGRIPKLSVVNGMKWPEKPRKLMLHPIEERLLALRIPLCKHDSCQKVDSTHLEEMLLMYQLMCSL